MSRKVLVLNADYSALSICTVPKAFLLVYLDKAELVVDSPKGMLRTVDKTYPLPSVIRLNHYVSLPFKGVMLSRQNVFRRDGNKCIYCGSQDDLTLDHVLPKSRGGKTNWDNLVTACRRCNSRKGDQTPEEMGFSLPKKPYKPSFIMFLRDFAGSIEENWLPFLGTKERA
jgi:5-methylcytosine-specific restriction endonuclease McrA